MKVGDTIKIKSTGHKAFIFMQTILHTESSSTNLNMIYPNSTYLTYKEESLEYCSQILVEKNLHPWNGLVKDGYSNVFGSNLLEVKGGLSPREIQ